MDTNAEVHEGFTLDRIAEACAAADISDSQFESLSIELLYGAAPTTKESLTVAAAAQGKSVMLDTPDSMAESNARFAIDGAIQYGRENRNKPPSDDHWLMEYWLIGQQLRELGKTGWDNRTPLDPAEKVAIAAPQQHAQAAQYQVREIGELPPLKLPDYLACTQRFKPVVLMDGTLPTMAADDNGTWLNAYSVADAIAQRVAPWSIVAESETVTLNYSFAAAVLGALFHGGTHNPEAFEKIKQAFAGIMRGEKVPRIGDISCYPPATQRAGSGVCVGTISSGDIEGNEIDWDVEFDRKVVDALPQLRVPNQHFGLFMAPLYTAPPAAVQPETASFQQRVQPWMIACFGEMISGDSEERNHRFLEEALELVQACGCTQGEAHQLVDYVYGRPVGEPAQEVGGVMVTLAALCLANNLDMHANAETELARIWTKVEQIRAKQAAKPKYSPLPEHVQPDSAADLSIPAGFFDAAVAEAGSVAPETTQIQPDSGRDAALDALRTIAKNEREVFDEDLGENVLVCMDTEDMIAIAKTALDAQSTENAAVQSLTDAEKETLHILLGTLEKHGDSIPRCAEDAKIIRKLMALLEREQRNAQALASLLRKERQRFEFLHSTNCDADGWEWGVARVRVAADGRIEYLWGNSDHSDIDAQIAAASAKGGA